MKMTQYKKQSLYVWRFGIKRADDDRNVIYPQYVVAPSEHEARSSLNDYICYFAGKRPATTADVQRLQ
ncbi:host cell division inhibitor Icd-like protein [Rosenbergiella collisarenosi]|uniref:host cell division inhibitor Icd-like protein n=1 Tax=Rosenbergiella collisarenosi TaxID=1544695 RepID=UPI001F4DFCBD|nr:host cell division inhibitor Icd-like protein [Rosenbergiella collisarenosi]